MKVRLSLYSFLLVYALLILVASCKKRQDGQENNTTQVKIIDDGTGQPIEGAQVRGFACASRDWVGNCMNETFVRSATTNKDGVASFAVSDKIGYVEVNHEKYWQGINSFVYEANPPMKLFPRATIKVRFLKVNTHAPTATLRVLDKEGPSWESISMQHNLGLPSDTSIYLKGRGSSNENDNVEWFVFPSADNQINRVLIGPVARFDTAFVEVKY